jgi:hypothetical protein
MSPDLPRRPFTELTPPPGGFAVARRAATRRRRAKAAVASTSVAGAAVAVLALLGSSSLPGDDSLRVTSPGGSASPAASAVETSSPAPAASGAPETTPSAPLKPSPGDTAGGQPQPDPAATAGDGTDAQAAGYRTPELQRSYVSRVTPTSTTVCGGGEQGNTDPTLQYTVNWCTSAAVTPAKAGHDLTSQICRDSSSDATLTYPGSREVDFVVLRSDGKVVWRWSTDHPDAGVGHQLAVAREHCWVWTAHWTDVDGEGRALPRGSYTLVARSGADELQGKPEERASFTI